MSKIIPEMTRVALLSKRADLVRETPNFSKRKFLYKLSRSDFDKEWGKTYQRPGVGARILSAWSPTSVRSRLLNFKVPTTATENLFVKSVGATTDEYRKVLDELHTGFVQLENRDFDTGHITVAGEYPLADRAYADLLDRLSRRKFDLLTPEL